MPDLTLSPFSALGTRLKRCSTLFLTWDDFRIEEALPALKTSVGSLILHDLRPSTDEAVTLHEESIRLVEGVVSSRRIQQIVVCGHSGRPMAEFPGPRTSDSGTSFYEILVARRVQRERANQRAQRMVIDRLRQLQQSHAIKEAESRDALSILGLFYFADSGVFAVCDP